MELKKVQDYYEELYKIYPDVPKRDIKRIMQFGLKSFLLHNNYGGDVLIQSPTIWMYCGKLMKDSVKYFEYYKRKMITKDCHGHKRPCHDNAVRWFRVGRGFTPAARKPVATQTAGPRPRPTQKTTSSKVTTGAGRLPRPCGARNDRGSLGVQQAGGHKTRPYDIHGSVCYLSQ